MTKTKSFRFAFLILLIFPIILLFSPLRVSALGTFYNYKNGYDPSDDIADYQGLLSFLENNYTSSQGTYKYIVLASGSGDTTHCRSIAFENYDVTSVTITTTGSSVTAVSVPQYRFWVQNNAYNTSTNTWYANGGSGGWLSGNISESDFRLAYSNVDFTVDGVPYSAFETPDTFYCAKDGYNINYGVYCNEYSTLLHDSNLANVSYFTTDLYWVQFSIPYNNNTLTVQPNGYMYNRFKMALRPASDVYDDSTGDSLPLMYFYADANWQSWMRGICAKESSTYSLSAPLESSITDISQGTQFPSQNSISLNMLLNAYHANNPSLAISDLFTEITVDFIRVSDHENVYSYTIDYSSLDPDTVVPADDGNEPDPFDTLTNLINNYNNYFDQMFKGDIFVPPSDGKLSLTGLSDISVPDFDLDVYELDDDPITWFGAFVEWWYSSPFGLIALASLTFLIVKTILW